jgi:hypothetical protein
LTSCPTRCIAVRRIGSRCLSTTSRCLQNYEAAVTRHVRTDDDPMALLPAVRRIVSEVDPRVALVRPQRLEPGSLTSRAL